MGKFPERRGGSDQIPLFKFVYQIFLHSKCQNHPTLPRIHFDPNFRKLAKITYNPLVYIYTSGLGQFLKKSTDILEKYGIFRVFWLFLVFLGLIFTQPHCFGPFFGVGQIFLVSRHHGGHHRSILIFGLFHFLAIFGHFLAVFAFLGHFCIFKWF